MRRLLSVLSLSAVIAGGLAVTSSSASADLRDDCYDRYGYRGAVVCNKIPPGV